MNRMIPSRLATAIVAATLALSGVAGAAMAQPTAAAAPAALAGKPVLDADGKALGVVERAVVTADGRVKQVLVRTKKGPSSILRTLPFSSLRSEGDALVTVLTKAEFEAIPSSQVE